MPITARHGRARLLQRRALGRATRTGQNGAEFQLQSAPEAPPHLEKLACYVQVVMRKSKKLAALRLPRERTLEVCLRWLSVAAPPVWATLLVQAWWEDISPSFIFGLIAFFLS